MRGLARRLRPTPSMAVALTALIVSLGGTSFAATRLAAHSVGTKELKAQGVARSNLKDGAVDGSKVAKNSLAGDDVKESSLGQVPLALKAGTANLATNATNAGHAGSSAGLDRVTYRSAAGNVAQATVPDPVNDPNNILTSVSASVSAGCDNGQVAVGGGVQVDDPATVSAHASYPGSARSWTGVVGNDDVSGGHSFTVYVICLPAGLAG
jgi:hypothetical protein